MTTPPILGLGNAIRLAIEDGHQGLKVVGTARAGKTYALKWLMERTAWHNAPLACVSVRVPRHTKLSDGYVYQLILTCCRQKLASRLPDLETLARVRDLLEHLCQLANTDILLLLVDEAQRLHVDELADFVTVANEVEVGGFRVCVVFVHQLDVTGSDTERARAQVSPQIKGRFGMAHYHLYGLRGETEVAAVLKRYDENAKWPIGSEVTYTRHFAPDAYMRGWRLEQHAKEILEVVEELRATRGLPPLDEWPMKTFELFVQRTLTRIVTRPGFERLTRQDIQDGLDASGYIPFEFCRAHMIDTDED